MIGIAKVTVEDELIVPMAHAVVGYGWGDGLDQSCERDGRIQDGVSWGRREDGRDCDLTNT